MTIRPIGSYRSSMWRFGITKNRILVIGCKASVQTTWCNTDLIRRTKKRVLRKKLHFSVIFTFHIRFSKEKAGHISYSHSRPLLPVPAIMLLRPRRNLKTEVSLGAFHHAKDSGNFGRNSNRKVRFSFFWPEYSGSPLEVVHIFRSEYSDRSSPFHF